MKRYVELKFDDIIAKFCEIWMSYNFEHINMSIKNFICIYVSFKIKRHNITHM